MTGYGIGSDNLLIETNQLTDDNGSVFFEKFKPDSNLCFVATAAGENHLLWWKECTTAPAKGRKVDITINLENNDVSETYSMLRQTPSRFKLF